MFSPLETFVPSWKLCHQLLKLKDNILTFLTRHLVFGQKVSLPHQQGAATTQILL